MEEPQFGVRYDSQTSQKDAIDREPWRSENIHRVDDSNNPNIVENIGDSSEDDEDIFTRKKNHVKMLSDSKNEVDKENYYNNNVTNNTSSKKRVSSNTLMDSDSDTDIYENIQKSRLLSRNETDSDSSEVEEKSVKNKEQQLRMQNKRNNLNQKFKQLVTSRSKDSESRKTNDESHDSSANSDSDSDAGISSISSIKQIKKKIKERPLRPSICDPDTSDDEDARETPAISKERNRTKLISPRPSTLAKPSRMSAKQALENMQKIKSESNRMLREQQVSLPYHRPKALLLKDIMNRRKPAVTAEGKALPIKMNNDQLKQYILQLEQRQKEMIELCKSESEDEEPQETIEKLDLLYDTMLSNTVVPKTNILEITQPNYVQIAESANLYLNETDNQENYCSNEQINEPPVLVKDHNTETNAPVEQVFDSSLVLVYNDSVESVVNTENTEAPCTINFQNIDLKENTDKQTASDAQDSQLISLHIDTEKTDSEVKEYDEMIAQNSIINDREIVEMDVVENHEHDFSDDDINMEDIDSIIENAVLLKDIEGNSTIQVRDHLPLKEKPRLTGAPGMVIDLDNTNSIARNKLTGVELLKERFTYFARLKTPEEIEREKKKRIKPGMQHLKLKQELEEKISEQRSLEWAKRLEEEKQQHMELNALRGDASEGEDDIDKIESKLEQDGEVSIDKESSESDEEEEEDVVEKPEKPREKNPMIADEAEESDCDQAGEVDDADQEGDLEDNAEGDQRGEDNEESEQSSDEESSESETDTSKPRKGRILKAFEDSDDEDTTVTNENATSNDKSTEDTVSPEKQILSDKTNYIGGHVIKDSQDDIIQLAQRHVSSSDDLFTSQDSAPTIVDKKLENVDNEDKYLGTQTFSILVSGSNKEIESEIQEDKLSSISVTQTFEDNFDMVRAGEFTQNIMGSQLPIDQCSQSQPIGDDVLALCTGKFYDNQFISMPSENIDNGFSQDSVVDEDNDINVSKELDNNATEENYTEGSIKETLCVSENLYKECKLDTNKRTTEEGNILKTILDELDDPEFDSPKPNKYFTGNKNIVDENDKVNKQHKKKFIIDSDEETIETSDVGAKTKKKLKKKKAEQRALHISDDEEEEDELEDEDEDNEYISDLEEDPHRIVEYDSEENEVEISVPKPKKKRKATDFFEQEAELTSEDEWLGSGDEDEAGLDRMEREAGDDDTFHQGKLQDELGQIHIRDVLDQDKREVRIIQELLFEDGDLGDGHRQRKFRWKNADGEEESAAVPGEFADSQEDEFESEEQWRKQRHEREVFLRQMKYQDEMEESPNVSVNRTTIIKANLGSKTMPSLLMEVNTSKTENPQEKINVPEKRTVSDIPSPKKGFPIFKQNYHGSLLTRGRGALARLAALATPLAVADDDTPTHASIGPTSRRNFVFTALTPEEHKPKVTKRKADSNANTPRLVKKMKTEEKLNYTKNSLLDHMKVYL